MPPRKKPGVEARTAADGKVSYRIRWHDGGGRAGRYLSHTFTTQKAAADALMRIGAAGWRCHCTKHAPEGVAPTKHYGPPSASQRPAGPTFGDYAARHIDALTGVGPGYRKQCARDLERHLGPFASKPLDGITELDVREWIRGMETGTHPWLTRGMSATTIKRLLVQAGSVIVSAQADGLASRNPFKGHRLGRRDRDQHTEMTCLTPGEWQAIEASLPAGTYRDMCTVLVGTGLRWGEVTALAVGAVDPLGPKPVLRVTRAWQDNGRGGYQLGTPKSLRSRRTVDLSPGVLEALIPHLSGKRDDELVFTTPSGRHLRASNFLRRVWQPALARAAAPVWSEPLLRRPRVHDLRHTHVSWLIAAGVDIAAVSRRVGHESITTTVDRYHHILPQVDAAAVAAIDAAMPTRRA